MDQWGSKTVLITGATGLLGFNLAKILLNKGARVIALGRSKEKILGCYDEYIRNNDFTYLATDICNPDLQIQEPIDYIFHAAGSIELKAIVNKPMDIINPNVVGTMACLDLLRNQERKYGKPGRMIYFSSEAVYGKDCFDRKVTEADTELSDSILNKRTPYSCSKRMAEVIVNSYVKQYNIDAINVRFSWVYGNTKYRPKQALFDFIESALSGTDIYIKNSNTPRRDNIFIEDAIAGLLIAAEKGIKGEAYNISSGGDMGNFAAADEIANVIVEIVNKKNHANKKVKLIYENDLSEREGGILMDNTKLKLLGWNISKSLKDGIDILVEEVKKDVY